MNCSRRPIPLAYLCGALVACSSAGDLKNLDHAGEGYDRDGREPVSEVASREAWNRANDPSAIDRSFILQVDGLPLSGTTDITPWPGDYWPTYQDSINRRWDGSSSLSPAEKWEQAFGRPGFAKFVSQQYGILANLSRKECTTYSDCTATKDGSSCAIPRGETKGRCIPTWWGICPGWAAAANSEQAPRHPVTKNGVTFYPGDIEALLSLLYAEGRPRVAFLSERCNERDLPTDLRGRIADAECRDMNPASYHVTAANMIGLRKKGFVVDHKAGYEVWNQPVRGFRVTNAVNNKLVEITLAQAVEMLALNTVPKQVFGPTPITAAANKTGVYKVTTSGAIYMRTQGKGDVELYASIGDDPAVGNNQCDATGTGASQECRMIALAGDEIHYRISTYGDDSTASLSVAEPVPGLFASTTNPVFSKIPVLGGAHQKGSYKVLADGDAVVSVSSTVKIDVLIKKGDEPSEWNSDCALHGPSMTKHCGVSVHVGDELFYDIVPSANAEVTADVIIITPVVPKVSSLLAGTTIAAGTARTGQVNVTTTEEIVFSLTGVGTPDLYVRKGAAPTYAESTCKAIGNEAEKKCRVQVTQGDVVYYAVVARRAGRGVRATLSVTSHATPDYLFNPNAKRFFHVKSSLDWVSESSASRTTRVGEIAYHTITDNFEYILEADARGVLLGGEWLGASRDDHLDFMWWNTTIPLSTLGQGMLSYAEVRALAQESLQAPAPRPPTIDGGAPPSADGGPRIADGTDDGADSGTGDGLSLAERER